MLRETYRALLLFASCATASIAASPAVAQNQVWMRQLGTQAVDSAQATVPDGAGGVYVTGSTVGNLGGPNAGNWDVWLARYDGAGNQIWIRQLGTNALEYGEAASPDGAGGVFICGRTQGSLGGPNAGFADAWLAHYDGAGNQLWVRQLGTAANDIADALASDGSGGVFVGGSTNGLLAGPTFGAWDAWVARYDGAGNQLWIRQFGTIDGAEFAEAAASDGSGGVFLSGHTSGSLGGSNAGSYDTWTARYDSAGNQLWVRQLGSVFFDDAMGAAPDGSGGLYVGGETQGNLGGANAGDWDAWLGRYDGAGNLLWVRQLGTSGQEFSMGFASDGSGGAYVSGSTQGALGGPSAGTWDIWLARYDGAGTQIWIRQLGSLQADYAHGAAPDGTGGVYVCGNTDGDLGGPNAGFTDGWLGRFASSLARICEPGVAGVIACPCSNPPLGSGRGCDNSSATGGARIQASGDPSLANDTLAFTATAEKPTALSILLQGTAVLPSGAVYGQGVRCAGGSLKRLFNRSATLGTVTLPNFGAGDSTISARSAALGDPILAGQSRWYLVYYRDQVVLGGCPSSSTFNSGPTMQAEWAP